MQDGAYQEQNKMVYFYDYNEIERATRLGLEENSSLEIPKEAQSAGVPVN